VTQGVAHIESLEQSIVELFAQPSPAPARAREVVDELLALLESGTIRAARPDSSGRWKAVVWVKQGILLGFRIGAIADMSLPSLDGSAGFAFFDKDTFPVRRFRLADGVRIVPGGTSIRRGACLERGVVCMPPSYVNVGSYVGSGTMIDSHALVGSCAQVGERVHLSAAAQLGGVLEPINASPVVIEDDVVIGGNCGVYEGTVVRSSAVLGSGVILTRGTPVYDLVNKTIHRASADGPLEIPPGAVVVPGSRPASGEWGMAHGLSVATPIIVKYRDARTDASTALEQALR
jgi:2,3,4,5-tetrahydropyridine-2-carboxylate N-succinyltransferase